MSNQGVFDRAFFLGELERHLNRSLLHVFCKPKMSVYQPPVDTKPDMWYGVYRVDGVRC